MISERPENIDCHDLVIDIIFKIAEDLVLAAARYAGIVQQHVDRRPGVFAGQRVNPFEIRDIELLDRHVGMLLRYGFEFRRLGRIAACRDDAPAFFSISARYLKPDAAARTGDQHGGCIGRGRFVHRPRYPGEYDHDQRQKRGVGFFHHLDLMA